MFHLSIRPDRFGYMNNRNGTWFGHFPYSALVPVLLKTLMEDKF